MTSSTPAARVVDHARVHLERLAQLRPHPQRRVERGRRVLRDVGDPRAAQRPEVAGRQLEQIDPVEADLAAADPQPAARVAEQGERHGGLARARLADQAEHLAGGHLEEIPLTTSGPDAPNPDLQVPDDRAWTSAAHRRRQAAASGGADGRRSLGLPGVRSSRRTASSGGGPRRSSPARSRR
jgi:hypothetical protein